MSADDRIREAALRAGLDPASFADYVRERQEGPEIPAHLDDLALAAALAGRAEGSAARFENEVIAPLREGLPRLGVSEVDADDVLQGVQERLLLSTPPKIAEYVGRGSLVSWVRVVVARAAFDRARSTAREVPMEDLPSVAASSGGAELGMLRERFREAFPVAFHNALASLDARQRNLLRYRYADGLSIDEIGALQRVHRATAARRVADAEASLAADIRTQLGLQLGISDAELESAFRDVRSVLEVSLRAELGRKPRG